MEKFTYIMQKGAIQNEKNVSCFYGYCTFCNVVNRWMR